MFRNLKQRLAVGVLAGILAIAAAPLSSPAAASGADLTYGTQILLLNQYGAHTYLDTNGLSSQPGAKYDVSTNVTPNSRGGGTSNWMVMSATGKAAGTRVVSGDVIYLVNMYGAHTYLDTNGHSSRAGAKYEVSTATTPNRGPGTAKWHIFGKTSTPWAGGYIRMDDMVHLLNDYGSANGGFLDTNGYSTQSGAMYDVSTSHYTNRGAGTGTWQILPA